MISHTNKFIFIHINCCGGNSIEKALKTYGYRQPYNIDPDKLKCLKHPFNRAASMHMTGLEFYKCYGKDVWSSYYKFAFVRNPFSRMVNYFAKRARRYHLEHTVNDFKKILLNLDYDDIIYRRGHDGYRMKTSCFHWLSDHEEKRLLDIDFIGKLENLQNDFNIVSDKLRIPQQQLPHVNKSDHKHYTEYYDEEAKQIVASRFAKDIQHFGYKFGD